MNKSDTKSSLDAVLVNAITTSTQDVFRTMLNSEITLKELKAEKSYNSSGDLSAVIGITGEGGEGMMALSFTIEQANLIVSRLLGSNPGSLTMDDRGDGVGELTNMICGNTKTKLARESGTNYTLSLPTIIVGKNHEIQWRPKNSPFIHMVFELEGKAFDLQVAFKFY